MFFETTDRADQSRLSAFVRNSGLDRELKEDAPGFGSMFDNVGGRWTADLHMSLFLAVAGSDVLASKILSNPEFECNGIAGQEGVCV